MLIRRDVTIIGAGQTETVIDGGGLGTVIWKVIGTVTIEHLTVTNGYGGGFRTPGGIYNGSGAMTLRDVTVTANTSVSAGGGIYGYGPLTLARATITDNSANHGGGIALFYFNGAEITDSVIANNIADTGGAIASGVVTLVNSTVSHNTSRGWAGGIYVNRYLAATHSTIAHNRAAVGGAMFVYSGRQASIDGSILAGNGPQECYGTVLSGGYNVLASTAGCNYVAHATDLVADPLLGPLADNGGPTYTHELLTGSPAIDLIPPAECTSTDDQRGVTRPQGPGCDAGSFELVQNNPPVADANGPYTEPEGSPVLLDATGSYDPDEATGDAIISYEWDLDDDGEYDDADGITALHTSPDDGLYTVGLRVTDTFGADDTTTAVVQITNVVPTVPLTGHSTVDEGVPYALDVGPAIDPGDDTVTEWVVHWGDGESDTYASPGSKTHVYADGPASRTITVDVTDEDGIHTGVGSLTIQVDNVAPTVSPTGETAMVQYSDVLPAVTFVGCDVPSDQLSSQVTWSDDGGATFGDLPDWLFVSGASAGPGCEARYTFDEGIAEPAGDYVLRFTFTDKDGASAVADYVITVLAEDADVAFDDDNPVAVEVAEPEGVSIPFSLTVRIIEHLPDTPDGWAAPGDISLAEVSIDLVPVGPGGTEAPSSCAPTAIGTGYAGVLTVACDFDAVPVNTYTVAATVGGGYYTGYNEDVLVVYDPSLGFTAGGGWFYWPGTEEKTNFGYTMKYNKTGTKVQGSFLLIRHLADGTKYRVKSNALYGLALGTEAEMGWASFSGKATYLEPGMPEPVGNHQFVVYVEDHGEPGAGVDQVWLETHDKNGDVIPGLSMDRDAPDNTSTIGGGNIVVPH